MQNNCLRRHIEAKVALTIAQLMRREYALSPTEVSVAMQSHVVTVMLRNAISPMSRIALREDGGEKILQSVYAIFHDTNHEELEALVSGVVRRAVRCSTIEPDAATGDVHLLFRLSQ